jgi:hypothetical protein
MLRTFLWGLVPVSIGGGLAAGAMKIASILVERDVTETAADAHLRNGVIASAVAFFLAHLLVDAARAQFAAEPTRRSALAALWSAIRLVVRRPLRAIGVGAAGTAAALGSAALLMGVRLRIEQSGTLGIGVAWLLAQLAQIAIGWGRAARIFGLAELSRVDAADRARAFDLEPPTTSPPPVQPELPSPVGAATPLSPTGASGT